MKHRASNARIKLQRYCKSKVDELEPLQSATEELARLERIELSLWHLQKMLHERAELGFGFNADELSALAHWIPDCIDGNDSEPDFENCDGLADAPPDAKIASARPYLSRVNPDGETFGCVVDPDLVPPNVDMRPRCSIVDVPEPSDLDDPK